MHTPTYYHNQNIEIPLSPEVPACPIAVFSTPMHVPQPQAITESYFHLVIPCLFVKNEQWP